jgi:hypothetical protein
MKEPTLRTFSRHQICPYLAKTQPSANLCTINFQSRFLSTRLTIEKSWSTSIFASVSTDVWMNGYAGSYRYAHHAAARQHSGAILVSRFYRRTALFVSLIERKVSSIKSADAEQLRLFQSSGTPRYDEAFASRTAMPTWPTRVTANAFLAQVISRVTS